MIKDDSWHQTWEQHTHTHMYTRIHTHKHKKKFKSYKIKAGDVYWQYLNSHWPFYFKGKFSLSFLFLLLTFLELCGGQCPYEEPELSSCIVSTLSAHLSESDGPTSSSMTTWIYIWAILFCLFSSMFTPCLLQPRTHIHTRVCTHVHTQYLLTTKQA